MEDFIRTGWKVFLYMERNCLPSVSLSARVKLASLHPAPPILSTATFPPVGARKRIPHCTSSGIGDTNASPRTAERHSQGGEKDSLEVLSLPPPGERWRVAPDRGRGWGGRGVVWKDRSQIKTVALFSQKDNIRFIFPLTNPTVKNYINSHKSPPFFCLHC